jgi:hypothetical protein
VLPARPSVQASRFTRRQTDTCRRHEYHRLPRAIQLPTFLLCWRAGARLEYAEAAVGRGPDGPGAWREGNPGDSRSARCRGAEAIRPRPWRAEGDYREERGPPGPKPAGPRRGSSRSIVPLARGDTTGHIDTPTSPLSVGGCFVTSFVAIDYARTCVAGDPAGIVHAVAVRMFDK